jgi:hypothetical protein
MFFYAKCDVAPVGPEKPSCSHPHASYNDKPFRSPIHTASDILVRHDCLTPMSATT